MQPNRTLECHNRRERRVIHEELLSPLSIWFYILVPFVGKLQSLLGCLSPKATSKKCNRSLSLAPCETLGWCRCSNSPIVSKAKVRRGGCHENTLRLSKSWIKNSTTVKSTSPAAVIQIPLIFLNFGLRTVASEVRYLTLVIISSVLNTKNRSLRYT